MHDAYTAHILENLYVCGYIPSRLSVTQLSGVAPRACVRACAGAAESLHTYSSYTSVIQGGGQTVPLSVAVTQSPARAGTVARCARGGARAACCHECLFGLGEVGRSVSGKGCMHIIVCCIYSRFQLVK